MLMRLMVFAAGALLAGMQANQFEVASIRINPDSTARPRVTVTPTGQYTATATTVVEMIRYAYGIQLPHIVGGPGWVRTTRFDVVARPERPPSGGPDAVRPYVRTLLEARFGLRIREDLRESDAFILTLARPGTMGPRLQPTTADCAAPQPAPDGPPPPRAREGWPPCGLVSVRNPTETSPQSGERSLRWSAITMSGFAASLYSAVGAPVIDQTGLSGAYDLEYSYVPLPAGATASVPEGPNLLSALEEQLGLRLRAGRAPVRVLAIDAAENPTLD